MYAEMTQQFDMAHGAGWNDLYLAKLRMKCSDTIDCYTNPFVWMKLLGCIGILLTGAENPGLWNYPE